MDPILQALPAFAARYPEVEIDFNISDRRVDVVADQIDIALRMGTLVDSSLVARKIYTFRRIICAAPSYLERAGPVTLPDDLLNHECIYITASPGLNRWPFRTADSMRFIEVRGRMRFDDAATVFRAGLVGLGIVRVSDGLAMPAIQAGPARSLLMDAHVSEPTYLTALMPHGRQHSPKLRFCTSSASYSRPPTAAEPVEPNPPAPRAVPSRSAVSTRRAHDRRDHQLRDPHAALDRIGLLAVIDQQDLHFAAIVGVDRARGC